MHREGKRRSAPEMMSAIGEVEEVRPLLRGWSHAIAAVAAVAITVMLVLQVPSDRTRVVALLIFGLSMIALYTSSAVYNLRDWRGRVDRVLQSIDHSMIFVLIAGTYTPVCVILMHGPLRAGLLIAVWSLAALGILGRILVPDLPRWSRPLLYIGMGWIGIIALPHLAGQLPLTAIGLFVGGGLLYTIGAVIYALRFPNPFPRVFGFHEIFHLFVIAGSAAFVALIWGWVVPGVPG
jgi:hemolysin III